MLTRVIYLTIRHYLPTLVALVVLYLLFITYLDVDKTLMFLLTILISWLQPSIDKFREIKRQVEVEERAHPRGDERERISVKTNWSAIFDTARKPLLITIATLASLLILAYAYLYIRLRNWW